MWAMALQFQMATATFFSGTHSRNMMTEMFKVSLIVMTMLGEFCNYLPGCWFTNSHVQLWEFCR